MNYDHLDIAIARMLESDGQISGEEIGRHLGLSQSAVSRRIQAMMSAGIIKGYAFDFDIKALGFEVVVYCGVKLALKGRHALQDFETAVAAIPEVVLVQHVLGIYDYRLRVIARDLSDFERILRHRIMTLPGVGQVESNVRLTVEST